MPIEPADSEYIRNFVYRRAGITLGEDKDYLLQQRLQPLVRRHGLIDIAELVVALRRFSRY